MDSRYPKVCYNCSKMHIKSSKEEFRDSEGHASHIKCPTLLPGIKDRLEGRGIEVTPNEVGTKWMEGAYD